MMRIVSVAFALIVLVSPLSAQNAPGAAGCRRHGVRTRPSRGVATPSRIRRCVALRCTCYTSSLLNGDIPVSLRSWTPLQFPIAP
jgi:hypothetical protein